MLSLISELDELYSNFSKNVVDTIRRGQVGSGQRGDKIRTYRYQDDRVHDHQTGKSATCKKVMSGNFDLLW